MSSATDVSVDQSDAFELDIELVESGEDLGSILYDTSDGCGATCQSACTSCS